MKISRTILNGTKIICRDIEVENYYSSQGTIKLNRKVVHVEKICSEFNGKSPAWKVKESKC